MSLTSRMSIRVEERHRYERQREQDRLAREQRRLSGAGELLLVAEDRANQQQNVQDAQ
jgi:hypothetical protein